MWRDGLVIHSWGFPNCSFIFFYSHLLKPEGFGKWLTGNHNKADPLSTLPSQFIPRPFISIAVSVIQMHTLCPVNCNITSPITQTSKQANTGINTVDAADLQQQKKLKMLVIRQLANVLTHFGRLWQLLFFRTEKKRKKSNINASSEFVWIEIHLKCYQMFFCVAQNYSDQPRSSSLPLLYIPVIPLPSGVHFAAHLSRPSGRVRSKHKLGPA